MKELSKEGANTLSIDDNGNLFLRLASKGTRKIGILHQKPDGIISYYKDEKESEVFRKNNSWSICYEVLRFVTGTINYRTETGVYRISVEDVKQHGSFLWFKIAGFERKLYIEKKYWKFEEHSFAKTEKV